MASARSDPFLLYLNLPPPIQSRSRDLPTPLPARIPSLNLLLVDVAPLSFAPTSCSSKGWLDRHHPALRAADPTATTAMPSVRASSPASSSSASSHSILYLNQLLPQQQHQRRRQQHAVQSHPSSGPPPGRRSTSSSSSLATGTGLANSATAATVDGTSNSGSISIASSDDFEHLLSRQDTLKMSLTPNRVRHAGMVIASSASGSGGGGDGNGSGNRYRDWEEDDEGTTEQGEVRAGTL